MRPTVAVIGAGAAATTLARRLAADGWPIGPVVNRSMSRARERTEEIGAGVHVDLDNFRAPTDAPLALLVGVPDGALAEIGEHLASLAWPDGTVALHLSGVSSVDALAALREDGVAIGALHPLTSFTDPRRDAAALDGTTFAVRGDAPAVAVAEAIAASCGGHALAVDDARRAAWHAGAAHASNHVVAAVDQALELLGAAGVTRDDARAALVPLLASVVSHLADGPTDEALTGPVARGDVDVVRRHVEACRGLPADVGDAYRALCQRAVAIAERSGRIAPEVAASLRAALAPLDD